MTSAAHWFSLLAGIAVLGAMPNRGFSQAQRVPDRAEQILKEIEAAQADDGPRSPALIQLLA